MYQKMTLEELHILCEAETRSNIEKFIERKHSDVALDKSLCHSALVAGQVKYLQRARTKLPSFYEARCVIPRMAFEQSSSEAAAEAKSIEGDTLLELTCGLGVDAAMLSRRFRRVVTLERDEVVAEVARENMHRLGCSNVEVVTTSAEEYLASCTEHFDWIYVDPDRRNAEGRKMVVLEDCSPNIIEVWSDIKRVAERVAIKCSPLFDVDEAFRLFEGCSVEVVSLGDECKEVVIYSGSQSGEAERIGATAVGCGEVWLARYGEPIGKPQTFDKERYSHLIIPNVALQKGRIARRTLSDICDIWSDNGFGFAEDDGVAKFKKNHHLARIERIAWIGEYEPRKVRAELAARGISRAEILKREFPYPIDRVKKQLRIGEGGERRIALTTICKQQIIIILE